MNEIISQEENRLIHVIDKEKKAKRLLSKALSGFNRAEVGSCAINISAYWIEGGFIESMKDNNSDSGLGVELNGNIAKDIVMRAIDKLENSIDFHRKQLKELHHNK